MNNFIEWSNITTETVKNYIQLASSSKNIHRFKLYIRTSIIKLYYILGDTNVDVDEIRDCIIKMLEGKNYLSYFYLEMDGVIGEEIEKKLSADLNMKRYGGGAKEKLINYKRWF